MGIRLTGSARQRESDAGALVLCDVMSAYCAGLRWALPLPTTATSDSTPTSSTSATSSSTSSSAARACLRFIRALLRRLRLRLLHIVRLFLSLTGLPVLEDTLTALTTAAKVSGTGEEQNQEEQEEEEEEQQPLCNGLLMATRYCLDKAHELGLFGADETEEDWKAAVKSTLHLTKVSSFRLPPLHTWTMTCYICLNFSFMYVYVCLSVCLFVCKQRLTRHKSLALSSLLAHLLN
jgi:hypothetical protein